VHTAIIIQCEQFTSAVETEARSWRRKFTWAAGELAM
jgi:hypothetical protein